MALTSALPPPFCKSPSSESTDPDMNSHIQFVPGNEDSRTIAGVDEVGRGPLAGPVVAAAVILKPSMLIDGLDDSKKLSAKKRNYLAAEIRQHAVAWSIAWCDAAEIDCLNILQATLLAMRRAVFGLRILPGLVCVDGNRLPDLHFSGKKVVGRAFVGGDGYIPQISAASIIAKVERDAMMRRMDTMYPGYGFVRHKGYGTEEHLSNLARMGPCQQHRRSFGPIRQLRAS